LAHIQYKYPSGKTQNTMNNTVIKQLRSVAGSLCDDKELTWNWTWSYVVRGADHEVHYYSRSIT